MYQQRRRHHRQQRSLYQDPSHEPLARRFRHTGSTYPRLHERLKTYSLFLGPYALTFSTQYRHKALTNLQAWTLGHLILEHALRRHPGLGSNVTRTHHLLGIRNNEDIARVLFRNFSSPRGLIVQRFFRLLHGYLLKHRHFQRTALTQLVKHVRYTVTGEITLQTPLKARNFFNLNGGA